MEDNVSKVSQASQAPQEDPVLSKFGGTDTAYEKAKAVILPVPYGKTASYRQGTENGPRAILDASCSLELFDEEIGRDTYRIGIHTADELQAQELAPEDMCAQVEEKVTSIVSGDKFPVIIGGEHTVTIGAVKALLKTYKNMSVFSLDAHHDLRDSYKDSKFSHACVNRRISEICGTVITGTRSLSKEEKNFLPNPNVAIFNVYDIQDIPNWKEKIRDALTEDVYLSIDLDVFDPSIMPSVGTPEPGGMGWYEVLDLIRYMIQYKNIVGMDVVELCPIQQMIAPDFLAAKLIYRILGYNFLLNNKRIQPKKEGETP
ncbi:MAG: agmatinase [Candidatus Omnitrophota bacterium]